MVRSQYATPLDDLLEEYGQGIMEIINPIDLESCRIGGVLYAIPNNRETASAVALNVRADIAEELGIEIPEKATYDEIHDILVQVHEAKPDLYAFIPLGRRAVCTTRCLTTRWATAGRAGKCFYR